MNTRTLALIAVSIATTIYGLTFTIAKDVMPAYVKPFGLILLRVFGAVILFWTVSLFIEKQKIDKKDLVTIAIAAFFGVGLNMLTFFRGLSLTSPISASVMMLTAPICVLILSVAFLKEKISTQKILGIITGLTGAVLLVVLNKQGNTNNNEITGNLLVLINAASYAVYMIISKKIITKYHPIHFVKWLYLFGLLYVTPFGYSEFTDISWMTLPNKIILKIGFIILFTTCLTYLFNLYGLSKLKPTTVSVFIYLQPVIATIFALITKSDTLDLTKISTTTLIFIGVFLVTNTKKPKSEIREYN